AFVTARPAEGRGRPATRSQLALQTNPISRLTPGASVDEPPTWSSDNRIYFPSDRDGVLNILSVDTLGAGRRETSAWTGAFDPVPLPSGGILVGGFHDLSWNVYKIPVDTAARHDRFAAGTPHPPGRQFLEV